MAEPMPGTRNGTALTARWRQSCKPSLMPVEMGVGVGLGTAVMGMAAAAAAAAAVAAVAAVWKPTRHWWGSWQKWGLESGVCASVR